MLQMHLCLSLPDPLFPYTTLLRSRGQHYCLSSDVSNPSCPRLPIPAMVILCLSTRVRAFVICPGAQARTRSSVNSCGCDVRHILMITPHRSPPRCSSLALDRDVMLYFVSPRDGAASPPTRARRPQGAA